MISIRQIMKQPERFLAHISEKSERMETLEEHTELAQEYFLKLMKDKNVEPVINRVIDLLGIDMPEEGQEIFLDMVQNIVTFHDVGKINPEFQKNIMKNKKFLLDIKFEDSGSEHSLISAISYINYYNNKIKAITMGDKNVLYRFVLFNSYIISKHHGNLDDMNYFFDKLIFDDSKGNKIINALQHCSDKIFCESFELKTKRIKSMVDRNIKFQNKLDKEQAMTIYAYMKLLYSLLVSADYYATAEFENNTNINYYGSIDNINIVRSVYEKTDTVKKIRKYENEKYKRNSNLNNETNINILRSEMFLDAEKQIEKSIDKNIFYLEAPTGSGKSNTAINLSLKLLERNAKGKIFYVYPFNTLVEQTINILLKTFDKDKKISENIAVINSITPIKIYETEDQDNYYDKALLDRQFLNYPIVVTTHVSLFHILFGTQKGDILGFYQLCDSVIVLDEIQSYKISIWNEIINFLEIFAKVLNIKIIIMSATLPDLSFFIKDNKNMETLIKDRAKYFLHKCFKDRVKISYELLGIENIEEELYSHIKINSRKKIKILAEFISTKTAKRYYDRLIEDNEIEIPVEYISGEDSVYERERILNNVKENEKIILIATQVVEAGIDLDMDIGYKDIAKVDSEEQFMGRINRSFREGIDGRVYFFDMDRASNIYHNDVRVESHLSIKLKKMQNILTNKKYNEYYSEVMKIVKIEEDFFKKKVNLLKFLDISAHMKLIEDDNYHVSVYFARKLVELNIDGAALWQEYRNLLENIDMDYSEKQVKLSEVKSKMNLFIYQITKKQKCNIHYNDIIGELYYIEEGEQYFENGKLKREVFDENYDLIC